MNEEQTSYKVTDRRLFNPDGSPRDVPESEKPEPTHEAKPASTEPSVAGASPVSPAAAATATSEVSVGAQPTRQDQSAAPSEATDPASAESGAEVELPSAEDPASFANFMMSIASNAASSLGMMEHPATGKREVDLELGKHWIDILGMLQEKTRGNLLAQEQHVLEGLLADLRMQYVSLTNATPKARTYTSRDITGG
jgi:hypothetical protein